MNSFRFAIVAALIAGVAGCATSPQQNYGRTAAYTSNSGYYGQPANRPANNAALRTVGGAGAGALIAEATGGSKTKGALIGAIAGGLSCHATANCY